MGSRRGDGWGIRMGPRIAVAVPWRFGVQLADGFTEEPWLNSMVYGRYKKLVSGGYSGL